MNQSKLFILIDPNDHNGVKFLNFYSCDKSCLLLELKKKKNSMMSIHRNMKTFFTTILVLTFKKL